MFAPDGRWDGRPLYKSATGDVHIDHRQKQKHQAQRGPGSDAALYWCRGSDRWYLTAAYSVLTKEEKREGEGWANCKAVSGRVPLGVPPQTWRCWIDKEWQDRPLTVKALRTPAARDAAIAGAMIVAEAAAELASALECRERAKNQAQTVRCSFCCPTCLLPTLLDHARALCETPPSLSFASFELTCPTFPVWHTAGARARLRSRRQSVADA